MFAAACAYMRRNASSSSSSPARRRWFSDNSWGPPARSRPTSVVRPSPLDRGRIRRGVPGVGLRPAMSKIKIYIFRPCAGRRFWGCSMTAKMSVGKYNWCVGYDVVRSIENYFSAKSLPSAVTQQVRGWYLHCGFGKRSTAASHFVCVRIWTRADRPHRRPGDAAI